MPKIGQVVNKTLTESPLALRCKRLEKLFDQIHDLPPEWLTDAAAEREQEEKGKRLETLDCNSYASLISSWRIAMRWRQSMDDVLSVMLAVAVSTMQVGDQLFLMLIGEAGGGKTRFCDAMLVSKSCYPLEHLSSFHSGYKDAEGNDYSLISRMNHKTIITPEGDVIMSSPNFIQIMSQQRRIFDGTSGSSHGNQLEDKRHTGLRTPWIMAGTFALLDTDQSRLGDRFIKVFLDHPDQDERKEIIKQVGLNALRSVMQTSNGEASKQLDPKLVEAYSMTGGYIDYLKSNVEELLSQLQFDEEWVIDMCGMYGEFTADLRARPDPNYRNKDSTPSKELPSRLTSQFVRLACCLAVVLNKKTIDEEVMRRVRKVALDTSHGVTLQIVKAIYKSGYEGAENKFIELEICRGPDRTRTMLNFLRAIEIVETWRPPAQHGVQAKPRWKLTERFNDLYEGVMR